MGKVCCLPPTCCSLTQCHVTSVTVLYGKLERKLYKNSGRTGVLWRLLSQAIIVDYISSHFSLALRTHFSNLNAKNNKLS